MKLINSKEYFSPLVSIAMLSVFNYDDYKAFITNFIASLPHKGRGAKSELARLAGCQVAYLSRVLHGNADFSQEQALAICARFGFAKNERDFFLHLVQKSRAGTPELREYYEEQLRILRRAQTDLETRFAVKTSLSKAAQARYYSSWRYLAIHVAISIPELQRTEALSRYFGIPVGEVREILSFLGNAGLANVSGETATLAKGMGRLHLGRKSELIQKHHLHWRLQASQSIEKNRETDLHYSATVSLSRQDALRLRELWVRTLDTFNQQVEESPEETLRCLTLDFFEPKL